MRVEKNQTRKKKWKMIFPLFILLIVIGVIYIFYPQPKKEIKTVCSIENSKYLEKIIHQEIIADYFFYGDVLNIKKETYHPQKNDDFINKTIILKNICSGKEYTIVLEKFIDRQIDLSKLQEGVYQVILMDNLDKKTLVFAQEVPVFSTITKHDEHLEIEFLNQSDGLKLNVVKKASLKEKYDIVVDSSYYHKDLYQQLTTGIGQSESIAFVSAKEMVEQLNKQGYRAKLIRFENEMMDVYGDNGRLIKLYNDKIKYYFNLSLSQHSQGEGIALETSYLASKNIPNSLMYALINHHEFYKSTIHHTNEYGVIKNEIYQGNDESRYYDENPFIREAGGYATSAGTYSKLSEKNTFAKENKMGIQTYAFILGNVNSEKDIQKINTENLSAKIIKYWSDLK